MTDDGNSERFTLGSSIPDDQAFLYELYGSTRREEMAAWGWDSAQEQMFLNLQFTAQRRHHDTAFPGADHKIILSNDRPMDTKFLMHYGDSQTAELELTSVADVGSSPRQIQFSLLFQGPDDAPIAQGIYKFEHDTLGALDMFLVPIGKDSKGVQYQAIFNRALE